MNYRILGKTAGAILLLEAACMGLASVVSLIYRENPSPFLYSILIMLIFGLPLYFVNNNKAGRYSPKDGIITVGLLWFILSAFGALPFFFHGTFGNYVNCFFEAVSGFTTTGASILTEIETNPKGILWWRSFTHFIGGMGVLVLANAIFPSSKDRAQNLLNAEIPGPMSDKLVPKLSASSKILYGIYVGIALLEVIFLMFSGLSLYDAMTISLATAGTGGFSVKNASIAAYGNYTAEYIIGVFMILFSLNFTVYFMLITGKIKKVLKNEELRFFLFSTSTAIVLITANLIKTFHFSDSFRYAFFTVASIVSTTGFVTVDHNLWPYFAKVIIVILMICGACAGSTGGGLKASRVLISLKAFKQELVRFIHPRAVNVIRFDGKVLPDRTVSGIARFISAYFIITFSAVLLISLDDFDFTSSLTAVISCMSNIGPGLGIVGPTGNFAVFSNFSKIVLSICMLIGRLEIYPILILFMPSAWKRN